MARQSKLESTVEELPAPKRIDAEAWGADRLRADKTTGAVERDQVEQPGVVYGGKDGWRYLVIPTGPGGIQDAAAIEDRRRKFKDRYAVPITGPLVIDSETGIYLDTPLGKAAKEHRGVRCQGIALCEIWGQAPEVVDHHFRKRRKRCLADPSWRQRQKDQTTNITNEDDQDDLGGFDPVLRALDVQLIAELKAEGKWTSLKRRQRVEGGRG